MIGATLIGRVCRYGQPGRDGLVFEPGAFTADRTLSDALRMGGVPLLEAHDPARRIGQLERLQEVRESDGQVGVWVWAALTDARAADELFERTMAFERGRGPLPGLSVGIVKPPTNRCYTARLREVSVVGAPKQFGAEVLVVTGAPRRAYPGPAELGVRMAAPEGFDAAPQRTTWERLLARATPADRERLRAVGEAAIDRVRDRIVFQVRPWSTDELDRLVAAELGLAS